MTMSKEHCGMILTTEPRIICWRTHPSHCVYHKSHTDWTDLEPGKHA